MDKIELRSTRKGDEKALAYIQTEAWKAAFGEILSPKTLEKYTNAAKAEEMYQSILENEFGKGTLLSVDGGPCCMAFWSEYREPEHAGSAELICIPACATHGAEGTARW